MKLQNKKLRNKNINRPSTKAYDRLAKAQSIAAIAASIAIPLILAVFGFLVQQQLASHGLKKDYVQIATNILKENPSLQDKELRKWAVQVLDQNSVIPFSANLKRVWRRATR
ncbi:hypothetical protein ACO0LO_27080 [Undibacterium sp. TJN25]|uniref:hypothetical protein n=1 Tax=Undibacterium sp. TJN25 TaxID=3413056 RepID=UPI003BF24C21